MKTTPIIAAAVLFAGSGLAVQLAQAQQSGIGRTEVLRHDLGETGREILQVRVDFAPGAVFGMHTHPGEEVAYVLDGSLEYQFEGKLPITLRAGDSCSSRPGRPTRQGMSATSTRPSSLRTSSRKGSRSSC